MLVLRVNNFDKELIMRYLPKEKWEDSFKRLETGYPVQYIIGNVEFYGLTLNVRENVLIPRFETEYLVDDLLKLINKENYVNPRILEIGSGSGCISLAIKKNLDCNIDAIDINPDAIKLSLENAKNNHLEVNFKEMDMNDLDTGNYDILVSNPPYVPYGSPTHNIEFEPENAIFAEDNGLKFYKIILERSTRLLNKKNIIAFEIGDKEGDSIKALALQYYPDANITIKKDLNLFERYVYIVNR